MAFTAKDLESWKKNELAKSDTFQFECAMCGSCCRKRREPILMTGADIFRIGQELDIPVEEVISKNMEPYVGESSHVPVIVLKERDDGSCRLLRKGRCMVQKNKPAVCALFPLGRYYNTEDHTFHYFYNEMSCNNGRNSGKTWTVQEWLDEFGVDESAAMTEAWQKLMIGFTNVTHKMPKSKITGNFYYALFWALYLGFDIEKPYIPQIERRMVEASELFRREFHKTIRFQ